MARNQSKLMNIIKWNEDLNAKHQQELQSDPVHTVTRKLCNSGDHYLQMSSGRAGINISEGKQRSSVLDSDGCAKLIVRCPLLFAHALLVLFVSFRECGMI
jgi:hypothetical protein